MLEEVVVELALHHLETGARKAALTSGILDHRLCRETILHFVTEPEAAALATFHDIRLRPDFKVGDSIVICNAGGCIVVSARFSVGPIFH